MGATAMRHVPPVLLLALLPGLRAQENLWTNTGVKDTHQFDLIMSVIGDINGDGHDDLIQRVTLEGRNPIRWQLWFLSGKDGKVLRTRNAYAPTRPFERLACAGDMDGDGIGDYAVAIGDTTGSGPKVVEVCSGKDDKVLWKVQRPWVTHFGLRGLAGDLDLDGDGKPDLVVGAHREKHTVGAVYAFSNSGKLLYKVTALPQLQLLGRSVAKVGDTDQDGIDDYVVGAADPPTYLGVALLMSGKTGKILHKGTGALPGDGVGWAVTGCGDLDADGVPDFAAGSCCAGRSIVRVFSGRTGQPVYTWIGKSRGNAFGMSIAGEIDVDRDGVGDLVISAPGEYTVYVYSGRDGTVIFRRRRINTLVYKVLAMKPQPGSPFPLFVTSAPGFGYGGAWLSNLGRTSLFRGSPKGVEIYGRPCQGTLASSPTIGIRDLGTRGVRIHLSSAAPASPAFLLLGLSSTNFGPIRLPAPLGRFGFRSCKLYTSIDLARQVITGASGTSKGYAFLDLPLPLATSLPGSFTLHGQWLSVGTGRSWPGALSDPMRWRH